MTEPQRNNLSWRMSEVERRVERLENEELGRKLSVLSEQMTHLRGELVGLGRKVDTIDQDLNNDMKSLRKTIIQFAFTIAGSALVVAFTVFQFVS